MRSSVNAALESNATRRIFSGLVNRLGWWSSVWSDIYPFGDGHMLPAGVGFAAGAVLRLPRPNARCRPPSRRSLVVIQAKRLVGPLDQPILAEQAQKIQP